MASTSSLNGIAACVSDGRPDPFPAVSQRRRSVDFVYAPVFIPLELLQREFRPSEFAARMRINTVTQDEKLGGSRQSSSGTATHAGSPRNTARPIRVLCVHRRRAKISAHPPPNRVTNPTSSISSHRVSWPIRGQSDLENIAVSQNDNDAYCRCPECEAINQREGTPMGANLALVNAVAERVESRYPNVKIGTLAYWYTRKAPKTIVPRKNVQIQLCSIECCELHPIDDPGCPKNREFCEDVRAWKAICDNVWGWNYNTKFSYYDLPFPNLSVIGPNRGFSGTITRGACSCRPTATGTRASFMICATTCFPVRFGILPDSNALVEEFAAYYRRLRRSCWSTLPVIRENAERRQCQFELRSGPVELGLTNEVAFKARPCSTRRSRPPATPFGPASRKPPYPRTDAILSTGIRGASRTESADATGRNRTAVLCRGTRLVQTIRHDDGVGTAFRAGVF